MRERYTILHVIAPGPVGGAESVVERLAHGQAQAGHRPIVAVVLTEPGPAPPLVSALERDEVEVRSVRAIGRAYLREGLFIARTIRELRPAVVHTHGYRADVIGGLVARWMHVPSVTTVHGFTGGDGKNLAYEWLQRRSFRRFGAVVAVSEPLGAELRRTGIREDQLHVVPNAWSSPDPLLSREEARRRLEVTPGETVLAWVGRLTAEKGPDVTIKAVAALAEPETVLHVLGDGRLRESLEELARSLGIAARVRWHGVVPEAARLFPAFDILILSSRTEGTPVVLFEAMHARVPIVATTVGGVPDVLSAREAWLVPPEDPFALASAVAQALADPAEARRRTRAASERLVGGFGVQDWLRCYEAVYRAAASVRG